MSDNTLLVLNGPGLADPGAGGSRDNDLTLERIRRECSALCVHHKLTLDFRQTNDDSEMCRWIANDSEKSVGLIINPQGYVKTATVDLDSYVSAIRSIAHLKIPIVEIHIRNIFRDAAEVARPLQAPECETGFICGLGKYGYLFAINAVAKRLQS